MKARKIHTLDLSVLLFLVFLGTSMGNGQIIGSTQIHSTASVNMHASKVYTVSKDGIYTALSDSGVEITRNTDAITIINQAITLANTNSGSVLIMDGDYSLSAKISMKSNVVVVVQLNATFTITYTPSVAEGILDFRSVTNAHFLTETDPSNESAYPKIIGKGTSNNECGVWMQSTTDSSVGKIEISNTGGAGIWIIGSSHNDFNGTYVHGFCKISGSYHHGVAIRSGSYNRLIDVHADGEMQSDPLQLVCYFGGEGAVTRNEMIRGIYERNQRSHAIYWCGDNGAVDYNTAYGGISKGCRGAEGYNTGFKINPGAHNRIGIRPDGTIDPWVVIDCNDGICLCDGTSGAGGTHDNLIYVKVINCKKGAEFVTQANNEGVYNNEIHLDVDGNNPNYPVTPGWEAGFLAFGFSGWAHRATSLVEYNTIYLKARNCQHGVVFADWDLPMLETQQAIHNTLHLDVEVSNHAIYWVTGCGGYGTYNLFDGYWHGAAGNCPTIPNANYVYTDDTSWMANIATNTFNPA